MNFFKKINNNYLFLFISFIISTLCGLNLFFNERLIDFYIFYGSLIFIAYIIVFISIPSCKFLKSQEDIFNARVFISLAAFFIIMIHPLDINFSPFVNFIKPLVYNELEQKYEEFSFLEDINYNNLIYGVNQINNQRIVVVNKIDSNNQSIKAIYNYYNINSNANNIDINSSRSLENFVIYIENKNGKTNITRIEYVVSPELCWIKPVQ